MAIMIGNAWRTDFTPAGSQRRGLSVTFSISGEDKRSESAVVWASNLGIPRGNTQPEVFPPNGVQQRTDIGTAVWKQLFMSNAKQKQEQKQVELCVQIVAQATKERAERLVGVFSSIPIRLISKPSKRRQNGGDTDRLFIPISFSSLH
jgi:hypothetical protein